MQQVMTFTGSSLIQGDADAIIAAHGAVDKKINEYLEKNKGWKITNMLSREISRPQGGSRQFIKVIATILFTEATYSDDPTDR